MSNKKKHQTIETLLEEALVPQDEQPYEVPGNWIWVRSGTCHEVITGSTPSTRNPELYGSDFPFFKPNDLGQGRELLTAKDNLTEQGKDSSRNIPKHSTLVCCIGSIGKAGFNLIEGTTNQQINTLVPNNLIGDPRFSFYQVLTNYYQASLWNNSSSTTISIINKSKMQDIPFVLPPIKEQKRVADKVERLLSKVDEAKRLIQAAKGTFESRRAAILDKAFSGELLNTISNFELTKVTLQEVCESVTDGDHQAPPKCDSGIPFLVIGNINKGILDFTNTRFVPREYYENINIKRKPRKGDVLYSVVGSYGIPVLVEEDKEFCFQRHIAILRPNEKIDSKFLYYMLQTKAVFNQATEYSTGTAQLTVPLTGLRKIQIQIPSIKIQKIIVETIERFISKEEQIINLIPTEYDLNNLKQSILSKAFKGELGTNYMNDENVIELLKEVLKEKLK